MDRDIMLERLSQDLIGPFDESEELKDARPSDVYLTGMLWPKQSVMEEDEDERLAEGGSGDDADESPPEEDQVSPNNQMRPSVAGLSFALEASGGKKYTIYVDVKFGTYVKTEVPGDLSEPEQGNTSVWKRQQHHVRIGPVILPREVLDISLAVSSANDVAVASLTDAETPAGARLHIRSVPWSDNLLVTATLVNDTVADPNAGRTSREEATLFQTAIHVETANGTQFRARPARRSVVDDEDRSLALLYRGAREFAVGHTCSAEWKESEGGSTPRKISSTWIPTTIVPTVSSAGHKVFERLLSGSVPTLSLDSLIDADQQSLVKELHGFVEAYQKWIDSKHKSIDGLPADMREAAKNNLLLCKDARERMLAGARLIGDDKDTWCAIRLAFIAMRTQFAWSQDESQKRPFIWRPFQLGFILLAIPSLASRDSRERDIMDLLWFPTGGGKTEAYLALVAFTAFHRRLRGGDAEAGVAAVMRYTLRLLTTQQFARAAAVILACEAIRRGRVQGVPKEIDLGNVPFSIGLWAGDAATPNRFSDARRSLRGDMDVSSPKQLAECPACGQTLNWEADGSRDAILVRCVNGTCILHGDGSLPVWTVDDDIYRECPTLVIGTIDKFAQIVSKKEINRLFAVSAAGCPPDLIIQDELHLISGPLGTVAGLYEVAIDRMFSKEGRKPKIIGSTATIRRASEQVRSLFNRGLCQFPPPGLDAEDSGFAVSEPPSFETPGRRYAAVTTAGRSAKFTLQAVSGSLLQSAGSLRSPKSKDYYGTLVSYFNSLRELGGALVLMQDDVTDSIRMIADRRDESRRCDNELNIEELTSRRTQAEIRDMLDSLKIPTDQPGTLDAVLATNMLSVGVDIPRLGLMVVNGQPKGISEYIQATSRVGRGNVPGLVITVLNNAKARDRSHFETFRTWHTTLYRDVEATSVTPFACRARDRALHAILVALCRHTIPGMLESPRIDPADEADIKLVIDEITTRANTVDHTERDVLAELLQLVEVWKAREPERYWNFYSPRKSLLQSAEQAAAKRTMGWNEGAAWPTLNNMRNVEPTTPFRLVSALKHTDTRE